nr:GNAT family N-acetyltransferase [Flavobacterium sp.]
MNYHFRKAELSEITAIWAILKDAIARRKQDGSTQWQDGYPNPEIIQKDIEKGQGFILVLDENIIGYYAILINNEPAYKAIEGKWITNTDFVVVHRVAIATNHLGQGYAKMIMKHIENFAINNSIYSVKADTNFDNIAMIKIFENSGYAYCGEIYFRGSPRKAYEKVLHKQD